MSAEDSIIASYQLDITVDYNQFFLEDSEHEPDPEELETLSDEEACARHVGSVPGLLNVHTAKYYGVVHLEVIVRRDQPDDILTLWDNVAEVSIEVPSGYLVVYAPSGDFDESPHLAIPPDTYRARVYASGVETVDEYMEEGEDYYRVVLWPGPFRDPALLHAGIAYHW